MDKFRCFIDSDGFANCHKYLNKKPCCEHLNTDCNQDDVAEMNKYNCYREMEETPGLTCQCGEHEKII